MVGCCAVLSDDHPLKNAVIIHVSMTVSASIIRTSILMKAELSETLDSDLRCIHAPFDYRCNVSHKTCPLVSETDDQHVSRKLMTVRFKDVVVPTKPPEQNRIDVPCG